MNFNRYASILVQHPYIILFAVSVFSITCLIIPFALKNFPNFEDPQLGYQTRGTSFANKLTTWINLVEETRESGRFTVNPKEFLYRQNITKFLAVLRATEKPDKKVYGHVRTSDSPRLFTVTPSEEVGKKKWSLLTKEGYFCGTPHRDYSHLVVESTDGRDLFTLEALQTVCRIQQEIIDTDHYRDLCVRRPGRNVCCRPWSLPNYVALLNDRDSCLAITEEDVERTKVLLQSCAHHYHSAKTDSDCSQNRDACNMPPGCQQHNAAFNILNYITPTSFLPPNKMNDTILKQTMIFLPVARSIATLKFYHEIRKKSLLYDGILVVAMDFGIKNLLFDEYLLRDTWLLSFGGSFVFCCMWFYTGSLFLTILTIIAIVFSLGISYFLYMFVFNLKFFPFMNLLTVVIALGIGTDDAFIFCKIWDIMKESTGGPLVKLMSCTMEHALISMIITSFTTAAAIFASYISSITAIKCFSIFASVAVLVNCFMMMCWFPACMVIWERTPKLQTNPLRGWFSAMSTYLPQYFNTLMYRQICLYIPSCVRLLETAIVDSVIKHCYFWFCSLSAVAVCSGVVVIFYPKLQLPDNNEFQLLRDSHPFEKYELVYRHKFWFTKEALEDIEVNLPLRFIWGLVPQDNGNYLEPLSYGTLKLDENFNMSHPDSQLWLVRFCKSLRKQSFYKPTFGLLLPNCFIETFKNWMSRRCDDDMENKDHRPCCESEAFPFRSWVFDQCIIEAISHLYATPPSYYTSGVAGPKFSKDDMPTIKSVVIEYESNYTFSFSYEYMNDFATQVDDWFEREVKTAPTTMGGGFFISDTEFYDLQRVLSNGTVIAVFVSMALALIVLFLATLNIVTSIFAIINITFSILVTMAVLILLGWKLNILESIAISTAIGLAVDFALHYTVNYKLSSASLDSRVVITRCAMSNMLKPVTMAALTTGIVGALMIPSTVMAYIQIGTFLVVVMFVSWLYSTFHLGSMLAIAGPQRNFAQYTYTDLFCNRFTNERRRPKSVRRDPANSSTSDTHELDLLTSKASSNVSAPSLLHRSVNETRNQRTRYVPSDRSPSTSSAVTVIVPDDP